MTSAYHAEQRNVVQQKTSLGLLRRSKFDDSILALNINRLLPFGDIHELFIRLF